MVQSDIDQFFLHKSWMEQIVELQESYLKQSGEAKAVEILIEQEKAKTLLQSKTANRTETFREWLAKQLKDW